jgi:arylsulfatase
VPRPPLSEDTGAPEPSSSQPRPQPDQAPLGIFVLGLDGLCLPLFRELAGPGLSALQRRSIDCTRVYADVPLCAPTRASVLTGLAPFEHGQIGNSFVLSEAVPTLIDHLSEQGLTCRLLGKQHSNNVEADGSFGYATVAPRVDEPGPPRLPGGLRGGPVDADEAATWREIEALTGLPLGGRPRPRTLDPDWVLLNQALDAATRDARAGQPFLVNAQLLAPHHPYSCPEAWYRAVDPADLDLSGLDRDGWQGSAAGRGEVRDHRWDELTEDQLRLLLARLIGMHLYADELLRYALQELEGRGLMDRVLFVFTSDHGEMAGAKGLFLKNVFELPATSIPLMLSPPWLRRSRTYEGLLSCQDVLPTLGGLMGLQAPEDTRGQDFSAQLRRGEPAREAVFGFTGMYQGFGDGLPRSLGEMVRTGRYTYCRFDPRGYPEGPMEQLYDLFEDPDESQDLSAELPEVAEALSTAIDEHLATMRPLLAPLEKV